MRILTLICVLMAALGTGLPASAQMWEALREQTPEEMASGQTDFWVRTLRLNGDQAAALHEINLRYAAGMSLAARATSDDATKLASMEAIEAQRTEDVLDLLTPAQAERYLDFVQQVERLVKKDAR